MTIVNAKNSTLHANAVIPIYVNNIANAVDMMKFHIPTMKPLIKRLNGDATL